MNKENIRNIREFNKVKALFEPHLLTEQGVGAVETAGSDC